MQYLLSFILAMAVTMAWLPVLVRLANKWLFIDHPGARKVHSIPIPRVGGIAMACGVLVAALVTINLQVPDQWFLLAAVVLIVFGALDDRFDLDYRVKLIGQLIAVSMVVLPAGVQIRTLSFDDAIALPAWVSLPLTVFFLVGVTNAINLADGLDGLAGGTTFLCLCAVALLSSVGDPGTSTALALAFAGAVLGFLRFNTYPASVFMGDAGSQLLGFTIGVLSVRATQSATSQVSAALPVLLLALPILDTLSVMVQRIADGRSPFSADKNHIHHKLLALGFVHYEAVMLIYAIQAALFVVAYFLRYESDLLILSVVTGLFAIAIAFLQWTARTGWRIRGPVAASNGSIDSAAAARNALLARLSYFALAASLAAYAAVVIAKTTELRGDLRILTLLLLAVVLGCMVVARRSPVSLIEKGVLFVTATLLVYLDAIGPTPSVALSVTSWGAVALVAITAAIRLRIFNDRRFELTPLDLIVLFMALVVPSLMGTFALPQGVAFAIAKLVIVLYGVEMAVSRSESRPTWVRLLVVSILSGLALKSFIAV